jgi:hypothetical protein
MSSCLGFGRKRDDEHQPLLPQVSYHHTHKVRVG